MESPIVKKFRIKAGNQLYLVNAPTDFLEKSGPMPAGVVINGTKEPHQVHWFVKTKMDVEKQAAKVISRIRDNVLLWIYFPKAASHVQTDLTRDKGWDTISNYDLQFITLVSFDETWSAFAMRRRSSNKLSTSRKTRNNFPDYIDPVNRKVKIPDDLAVAFKKHDKLRDNFIKLAFTHQKEYVEWILSAKREETRARRIEGTIIRLEKDLKNPSAKV